MKRLAFDEYLSFTVRQQEYIHRVGRTARGINGRGHALLILRPEELGFLRFLKQAKVTCLLLIRKTPAGVIEQDFSLLTLGSLLLRCR